MPPVDDVTADDLLTCKICGTRFEHSGRGRKPSTCPDHRGQRAGKKAEGEPRKRPGAAELERQIHGMLAILGSAVMMFDQFDGTVILTKAEKAAKAMSTLAANHPSIRHGLELGAELAGWGPVVMVGGEILLPILAHHGVFKGVPDPAQKAATDDAV